MAIIMFIVGIIFGNVIGITIMSLCQVISDEEE